jgi:hypothetical protein
MFGAVVRATAFELSAHKTPKKFLGMLLMKIRLRHNVHTVGEFEPGATLTW